MTDLSSYDRDGDRMALKVVDIHCLGLCRKSLPTPGTVPGTWLVLNKYCILRCQYLPSWVKHFTCAILILVITLNVGNSCYPISQMRTEANGPYIHVSHSLLLFCSWFLFQSTHSSITVTVNSPRFSGRKLWGPP